MNTYMRDWLRIFREYLIVAGLSALVGLVVCVIAKWPEIVDLLRNL